MNKVIRQEKAGECHGVEGRYFNVVAESAQYGPIRNQKFKAVREVAGEGRVVVNLRFDDELNNGHETFTITGEHEGYGSFGCIHNTIAEVFPELKHLIKWHLCSTDGPMHYIANTCYLAGDRDHHGLLKGEIEYGESEGHVRDIPPKADWQESYRRPDGYLPARFAQWPDSDANYDIVSLPRVQRVGEGKERQLDTARSIAIWPDATDEQLTLPRDELIKLLNDRLPDLITRFKQDMRDCGFIVPELQIKVEE